MDLLHVVNLIANIVICSGMTLFFVLLFGNAHSIVNRWPILQHWSLKLGLVTIISSSAWNALYFIYDAFSGNEDRLPLHTGEVLLNVGLAALFSWIVYFHKYHFIKVAPPKRRKKKSSRRKKAV